MNSAYVVSCHKRDASSSLVYLKQMQLGRELPGAAFLAAAGSFEELRADEVVQMTDKLEEAMCFETVVDASLGTVVVEDWFDDAKTQLIRTDDPSTSWAGVFFASWAKRK